ncbi:MAG TPA: hypothetical protein VLT86_08390 [Vicinamibacterales bacterium]|nr:hypothetical protein [Vicinamibacterales bacterium]
MPLTPSPTELTTAATDAALALLCVVLLVSLLRRPAQQSWRRAIWASVFALLAIGSVIGAIAHGLDLSDAARAVWWRPLYLSLGLCVALFVVGAIGDWRGQRAARAALPWATAAGLGFFAVTQLGGGSFLFFVGYEAVAMIAALATYLMLWRRHAMAGAGVVATGIALTLVAAAIQQTSFSATIVWPFDHNGLFHLIQMVAVVVIARGLSSTS